jgi:outer membrane receptor protein involved in Fe transport
MIDLAVVLLSLVVRVSDVQRPRIAETVTVSGAGPSIAAPAAITVLGSEELSSAPAVTLDDTLRSVPGFSLFRRSSSRVANPTTQGVTLRGLAASGSSRALVLADDVPLNDPVGGWVYWNRVPIVALQDASVSRGASGDLYGADTMGGVINLRSRQTPGVRLLTEGGADATARASAFGGRTLRAIDLFASAELFTTDGYIVAAPEARGPVDTPAASRYGNVHVASALSIGGARTTIRGAYFDESRDNGTPIQRNATEGAQFVVDVNKPGAGFTGWSARAYAATHSYEQTFSAISDDRTSERQTSAQDVQATTFGAGGDWVYNEGSRAFTISGLAKTVGARLEDTPYTAAGVRLAARVVDPEQVSASVAARGALFAPRWTAGGAVRTELLRTSADETNQHVFFSPRLWAAFSLRPALTLRAQFQSSHRGATINELYRPFRVGNILTDANPLLRPESTHGVEGGASWHHGGHTIRAIAFWSRVDDAIVNVTLAAGGPTILRQRRNAAEITARGLEIEAEICATASVQVTASTAFTDSTFVAGPLEGLRVPQVPRWNHAVGARASFNALRLSAEWRYIGRQFDDDRNAFVLDRSTMTDARAGWMLRRSVEIFAAVENLFDEEQDVGRTPLRTIGLPRTARAGVRLTFD